MEPLTSESVCANDYPDDKQFREVSKESLESLFESIRKRFELEKFEKFPGGVHGYLIFALLANEADASAQVDDFEYFTSAYPQIYSYFYGRSLLHVHERIMEMFAKMQEI